MTALHLAMAEIRFQTSTSQFHLIQGKFEGFELIKSEEKQVCKKEMPKRIDNFCSI